MIIAQNFLDYNDFNYSKFLIKTLFSIDKIYTRNKNIPQKYDFLVQNDKSAQEIKNYLQKSIIIKEIFDAYWHIKIKIIFLFLFRLHLHVKI